MRHYLGAITIHKYPAIFDYFLIHYVLCVLNPKDSTLYFSFLDWS